MSSEKIPANEELLRGIAASSSIRFGTNAPFELGGIFIKRIGFANIPVVGMVVNCRQQDRAAMVPIVRNFVFTELVNAGISNTAVKFIPTVNTTEDSRGRQVMFTDCNESSPTKGKRKRGHALVFHFEIQPDAIGRFTWQGGRGQLPEARRGQEEGSQEG